ARGRRRRPGRTPQRASRLTSLRNRAPPGAAGSGPTSTWAAELPARVPSPAAPVVYRNTDTITTGGQHLPNMLFVFSFSGLRVYLFDTAGRREFREVPKKPSGPARP